MFDLATANAHFMHTAKVYKDIGLTKIKKNLKQTWIFFPLEI